MIRETDSLKIKNENVALRDSYNVTNIYYGACTTISIQVDEFGKRVYHLHRGL